MAKGGYGLSRGEGGCLKFAQWEEKREERGERVKHFKILEIFYI